MKNYPKYLNTKEDMLNCVQLFPEKAAKHLQILLKDVSNWILISKLNEGEKGVEDVTHKIVEIIDADTKEVKERYQYEFKEDLHCGLFKLGFTKEEAEDIISRYLKPVK